MAEAIISNTYPQTRSLAGLAIGVQAGRHHSFCQASPPEQQQHNLSYYYIPPTGIIKYCCVLLFHFSREQTGIIFLSATHSSWYKGELKLT